MTGLTISLQQSDDGDGLARFSAEAKNGSFCLSVLFWGYAEQFAELASALNGFPSNNQSKLEFALGSPGSGTCTLNFSCVDGWGHVGLWVAGESQHPVFSEDKHQRAELALRVEAAAIDSFRAELLALAAGESAKAALCAAEP